MDKGRSKKLTQALFYAFTYFYDVLNSEPKWFLATLIVYWHNY